MNENTKFFTIVDIIISNTEIANSRYNTYNRSFNAINLDFYCY